MQLVSQNKLLMGIVTGAIAGTSLFSASAPTAFARGTLPHKNDSKVSKSDSKSSKSDGKPSKSDGKPGKSDSKSSKADSKSFKTDGGKYIINR